MNPTLGEHTPAVQSASFDPGNVAQAVTGTSTASSCDKRMCLYTYMYMGMPCLMPTYPHGLAVRQLLVLVRACAASCARTTPPRHLQAHTHACARRTAGRQAGRQVSAGGKRWCVAARLHAAACVVVSIALARQAAWKPAGRAAADSWAGCGVLLLLLLLLRSLALHEGRREVGVCIPAARNHREAGVGRPLSAAGNQGDGCWCMAAWVGW